MGSPTSPLLALAFMDQTGLIVSLSTWVQDGETESKLWPTGGGQVLGPYGLPLMRLTRHGVERQIPLSALLLQ